MIKKKAEVKTYILIGLRYVSLFPLRYSAGKNPGLRKSSHNELKNFESK
jgi:hypothetical protein